MTSKPFRYPPFLSAALATTIILLTAPAHAQVTVFAQNLAGFNAAAGNPPVSLNFDSIAPGTNITGQTINGITLLGPGAPLIVVEGNNTITPSGEFGGAGGALNKLFPTSGANVLSPGGLTLGAGPNSAVEDDDLTIVFTSPVSAFGFDHLSQSADGISLTNIQVFSTTDTLLFSGTVPIQGSGAGAAGGSDFWGIVSIQADIARIVIDETDGDASNPDANIGYDTFRYVAPAVSSAAPEPTTSALLLVGLLPLLRRRRHEKSI